MDLLLKDLQWHDGIKKISGDVRMKGSSITEIGENLSAKPRERVSPYKNHFIYPGLINAHDHLEMNLYPNLGSPPYNNYVEWANDIYKPKMSPLKEIESVNIKDRLLWGGVKNLISGVTTVVHHNPWHRFLGRDKFPVKVLKKMAWAHSLAFEKQIQKTFLKNVNTPFIVHAAEGKDSYAFTEISKLNELGLIKKNTVLIHAIALTEADFKIISANQTSIVWCPTSNQYMFNQHAPIQRLKKEVSVALGSDSTLTGPATLLHEMRCALQTQLVKSKEIFDMVTHTPIKIFSLPSSSIAPLHTADFFIAPIKEQDYFENLLTITPSDIALVVNNGRIKLADAENHWTGLRHLFKIQGVSKYSDVDVASLKKRITKKVEPSILELNPLWNIVDV